MGKVSQLAAFKQKKNKFLFKVFSSVSEQDKAPTIPAKNEWL